MNLRDPIASGNTANIYLYKNKIIKIFKDHLPKTASEYEARKQRVAFESGLRVPKILEVTKVDGKQAIIMEYVEGKTLGELVKENMDHVESLLEMSVDIQMEVHTVVAESLEPMRIKLQRQIEAVEGLDKQVKTSLLKKLESMTVENRLCHGDFHLYNLIKSDEEVFIIDWVDASAGNPRADVCRTYILYSQISRDIAELYLKLYCEKSGWSQNEILEWAPVIAAARLSENVATEDPDRLMKYLFMEEHNHESSNFRILE
ncbi:phosphotransferase family protein [Bacillus sp. CHD6a]|uniref:phosphotransferase family protein n=1 Tax=Bacillus sp. CHD6a TaxID=1643452 RepID=UPI0006CC818E|nr:aminoglycoside phosphotransferase family protein [Bacillus sp. CHD6a]KPB03267.1 aminoglycoside phosphotransferase [Bacillus sp. CHD6a]